jgi:hypothetical protein
MLYPAIYDLKFSFIKAILNLTIYASYIVSLSSYKLVGFVVKSKFLYNMQEDVILNN